MLRRQMLELQLEVDILKETINVLKKDRGADLKALKNREKAVIIDALKNRYSLPILFKLLDIPKSIYYYQESSLNKKDIFKELKEKIQHIFLANKSCYGYRRIHSRLANEEVRYLPLSFGCGIIN